MNRNQFRIVFNRARGQLMAVAETASSDTGGSASDGTGSRANSVRARAGLAMLAWAALCTVGALALDAPALAQQAKAALSVSPTAAAGTKPVIDAAQNGVPVVHIATPSAAGVSRNQYQQFNVDRNGLILNNSAANVQTQQGGWIAGNPQLGYVPARVIVNEVMGPDASVLKGTIEVAGRKADVVIANPNGLFCDGCAFLNTGRATLSTGLPTYGSNGSLTGFDVRQGQLGIGAGGLNASQLDQLDLFARGLVLEGEIWAQHLNVVTGANQVLVASLGEAPAHQVQEGTGNAPRFAIDIKDLGAMYANQVYIVATERGLGVNSTGRVAALQGQLQLAANGDVTLKDSYARGGMALESAGRMTLTGQTQTPGAADAGAAGDMVLHAGGALAQQGVLDSGGTLSIAAATLDHSGTSIQRGTAAPMTVTVTGDAVNSGTLYSGGDVALSARTLSDTNGQLLAEKSLIATAQSIALAGTQLSTGADIQLGATGGDLAATQANLRAGADLSAMASGQLSNVQGSWQARRDITLQGASIANHDGIILASGSLSTTTPGTLDNTGGKLMGGAAVTLTAGHLVNNASATSLALVASDRASTIAATGVDNLGGVLSAKTTLQVDARAGKFDNSGGIAVADDALVLQAGDVVNVQGGQIVARGAQGQSLQFQASSLVNDAGLVSAKGAAALNLTGALSNHGGAIVAGAGQGVHGLDVQAASIDNAGGHLFVAGDLRLQAGILSNTANASIDAHGDATLRLDRADNVDSRITANRVDLAGWSQAGTQLNNQAGLVGSSGDLSIRAAALSNVAGVLNAGGMLTVSADRLHNSAAAVIAAGADLGISAQSVSNNGGSTITAGRALFIDSGAGLLDNTGGRLGAQTQLALRGAQVVNRSGQIVSNDTLQIHADGAGTLPGVDNRDGVISAAHQAQLGTPQTVDNSRGQITSAIVTLDLGQSQLINAGGKVVGTQALLATQGAVDNTGGTLATGGDLSLDTQGRNFRSAGGTLVAGGALTLHAADLDNTGGHLIGTSRVNVQAAALTNTDGEISSQGDVGITSQSLVNGGQGKLVAGGALVVTNATALSNVGTLSSSAGTVLNTATLANAGRLQSGAGLTLNASQSLTNTGQILAAGSGEVTAGALQQSAGATLGAGSDLTVNVQGDASNLAGSSIFSQGALKLDAASLHNDGGSISAASSAGVTVAGELGNQAGRIQAQDALAVSAASLDNSGGALLANHALSLGSNGAVVNRAGQIGSQAASVTLRLASLDNGGNGVIASHTELDIAAQSALTNAGVIGSGAAAVLSAGTLNNSGTLQSSSLLNVAVVQNLANTGQIIANGDTTLRVGSLSQDSAALLASQGTLNLQVDGVLSNHGASTIQAQGLLQATAASVNNDGGLIASAGAQILRATNQLSNRAGELKSATDLTAVAAQIDNAQGRITTAGAVQLQATASNGLFGNTGGTVSAGTTAQFRADVLDNTAGSLSSGQALELQTRQLNNVAAGAIVAGADAHVVVAQLDNSSGVLASRQTLSVEADTLNNTGGRLQALGDAKFTVTGTLSNAAGQLASGGALALNAAQLGNQGGVIATTGAAQLTVPALDNSRGGQISAAALTLKGSIDNHAGGLVSSLGDLNLDTQGQALNNNAGRIQAAGALTLASGALGNVQGRILSGTQLNLTSADLDNTGGHLLGTSRANVQAAALTNTDGELSSQGDVGITSQSLVNGGQGKVVAGGALVITNATALSNGGTLSSGAGTVLNTATLANAGTLQSGAGLTLNASQSLANAGQILAAGAAQVTAGALQQSAGATFGAGSNLTVNVQGAASNLAGSTIFSQASLALDAASLRNDGGNISANSVGLTVAGELDNIGGAILATQALNLGTAGAVINRAGQIASGTELHLQAGALDNTAGQIGSQTASVTLRLASLDNGGNGVIASHTELDIAAQSALTNAGVIGSGAAAVLSAGTLSNSGTLQSRSLLNVAVAQNLGNAGQIIANGDTAIHAGSLSQDGSALLSSQGALNLQVDGALGNHGASALQSQGALQVVAGSLSNDGGQIASASTLALRATNTLSNRGGDVRSATDVTAAAAQIDNAQGRITAASALQLRATAANGTIGNAGGSLTAGTTAHVRADVLDNTAGSLSSGQALDLQARQLHNNAAGAIVAGGDAQVVVAQLDNSGGVLASRQALSVEADTLNNISGRLQALGDAKFTVTGTLSNAAGQLASGGTLDASAAQVGNQGGLIAATGAAQLTSLRLDNSQAGQINAATLTLKGGVDNHAGGLITSLGDLNLDTQGQALNNNAGRIEAAGALTLASAALGNVQGRILSGTQLNLTSADLDNTGGHLIGTGRANVQAAALTNTDGEISSQGDAGVTSQSLVNGGQGKLVAGGALVVTNATALSNGGTLSSGAGTVLNTATLANSGTLQSGAGLTLNASQSLANTGQILAAGSGQVTAGALQQSAGATLGAGSNLTVNVQGAASNLAGSTIFSQGNLALDAASLRNDDGNISATSGVGVTVAGELGNQAGHIQAQGALAVNAASLDNSGGAILANQTLNLGTTGAVVNHAGQIASMGALGLQTGLLDNTDGQIGSQAAGVTLRTAGLNNAGQGVIAAHADLDINTQATLANAGRIHGGATTTLNAATLTNSGTLQSGSVLNVTIAQNLGNTGQIIANGDTAIHAGSLSQDGGALLSSQGALNLQVDGTLSNHGVSALQSQGALQVVASSLSNDGGQIAGASALALRATNTLSNRGGDVRSATDVTAVAAQIDNAQGRITAASALQLRATATNGTVGNAGGSLTAGTTVLLRADLLDNTAGSLSSGQALDLQTRQVNNVAAGAIVAGGDAQVVVAQLDNSGGVLASRQALNVQADTLNNAGGRMQSMGNAQLTVAGTLSNAAGQLASGGTLDASATRIDNQGGLIAATGAAQLTALRLDNSQAGQINAAALTLKGGVDNHAGGLITSLGDLNLDTQGQALNNNAGRIQAAGALTLASAELDNTQGRILSVTHLGLTSADVDNTGGEISSTTGAVSLTTAQLKNARDAAQTGGLILSQASDLRVQAGGIDNNAGTMAAGGAVALTSSGAVQNAAGRIQSGSSLTLTAASLAQSQAAVLSATGVATVITTGTLSNQGGSLIQAGQGVDVQAAGVANNTASAIASGAALTIATSGALDNAGGSLYASQALTLQAASIANAAGQITSVQALRLDTAGTGTLDNHGGQINAGGALVANVGTLDNRGATLASASDLTITSTALGNAAGAISARGALDLHSGNVDNTQGAIGAQGAVSFQTAALANTGGKLSSGSTLNLTAQSLGNDQGSIVSGSDATVTLGQLAGNVGGTLASATNLTLRSAGAANNTQGLIQAAGELDASSTSLINTQGQLVAGNGVTLQTGDLTNDLGQINNLSGQARITTAALSNSGGNIVSRGDLSLTSTSIASTGFIAAANALDIDAQDLRNQGSLQSGADMHLQLSGVLGNTGSQADITAGGAFRLDAASLAQDTGARLLAGQSAVVNLSGALANRGGSLIEAQGALDVTAASVDNRAGVLASAAQLSLTSAGALNNAAGTIYSGQGANVRVASVDNTGGLVQANQALSLDTTSATAPAGSLINASGTLVAGTTISVKAGGVDNRAGTLGSVGDLTLQSAALDNSGGQLQSKGAAAIQASTLLNVGGSIATNGALGLVATSLDNAQGSVSAGTTLNLSLAQNLRNAGGHVLSTGDTVLALGSLDANQAGTISAGGALTVRATGALNNQAGSIVSAQALDVSGAGLDNRQGTLASTQGKVTLDTQGQALNNDGGTVLAAQDLTMHSGGLSNQAGLVRGASLDLTVASLDNRGGLIASTVGGMLINAAGAVNNDGGALQSKADLTLSAASLSNANTLTSGGILAIGDLSLTSQGSINNQAGYIGSGGNQTLTAGQAFDNSHGGQVVSAAAGRLQATALDNSAGGSIQAHGDLVLAASTSLNNAAGAIASDGTLTLQTPTLLNSQAGSLSAKTLSWAGTSLDNRSGSITASRDLTLNGQGINSDGGTLSATNTLDLTTPALSNVGGSILAGQSLQLHLASAASLTGTISSSGDLALSIQGNYTNAGQLSAARDLSIRADNVSNSGMLHATRDLIVTASSQGAATADGTIGNTGELSAGGNTTLTALTLNNSGAGVIDATGTTTLNVGTLNNSASIYGSAIDARASNAFNNTGAGSVMSRGDLSVVAPTINNTGAALMYASGDMTFGSAAGANQTLTNAGSRIEASGNITFFNTAVNNLNVGLTTATRTTTSTASGLFYKPTQSGFDSSTWIDASTLHKLDAANVPGDGNLRIGGWVLPSATYAFDVFGWNFYQEAYTNARCGMREESYDCSHGNYSFDDPVWARFHVASPAQRPVPPTPAGGCADGDTSPDCVALSDYNAAVRQDYANLQAAFTAFNYDLAYNRSSDTWMERQVTGSTTTETVVTNAGQAGQILAGGNISLLGSNSSVLNSSSRLVAGGALVGNVSGIVNQGVDGTRTLATSGTVQGFHQYTWGGGCCVRIDADGPATSYSDPGTVQSFTLATYTYQQLGGASVSRNVGAGNGGTGSGAAPSSTPSAQTSLKDASASSTQAHTQSGQAATLSTTQRAIDQGSQAGVNAQLNGGFATANDGYSAGSGAGSAAVALTATGANGSAAQVAAAPAVTTAGVSVAGHQAGNAGVSAAVEPSRSVQLSHVATTPGEGVSAAQVASAPTATTTNVSVAGHQAGNADVSAAAAPGRSVQLSQVVTTRGEGATTAPVSSAPSVTTTAVSVASHQAGNADVSAAVAPGRSVQLGAVATTQAAANAGAPRSAANAVQTIQVVNRAGSTEKARDIVLTTVPRLDPPHNSAFQLHAEPGAKYLVETDPRFANYKNFLSSDYFEQQLAMDPARNLKRYGDGFVEQQLVNDQILALSGYRFLGNFTDTETEYLALMNAGVAFAKQYQLTPGVALSAEQMALLTTDIVWLTQQTVAMADGSSTQVLVPQVYLRRIDSADLRADGALISARNIDLKSSGDIVNQSATLQSQGTMVLRNEGSISNLGGRLAAMDMDLSAGQDLVNQGGQLSASGVLQASAGRDILLKSTTQATSADFAAGSAGHTAVDRIATVQGSTVSLNAARDLLAQGAQLGATQNLQALAGRDLSLVAVQGQDHFDIQLGGNVQGRSGYVNTDAVTQTASTVTAGGNATLIAGANLALRGADLTAGQDIGLQGANVDIAAAKASQASDAQGLMRKGYTRAAQSDETLVGGTVKAGGDLLVKAVGTGNDGNLTLTGATLSAQAGQTALIASRDITLQAATTEHSTVNESLRTNSGLFSTKTTTAASSSQLTQLEGSTVSGHTMLVQAGDLTQQLGDLRIQASTIKSDGLATLTAGRDLVVGTVDQTQASQSASVTERHATGLAKGLSVANPALAVALLKRSSEQSDGNVQRTEAIGSTISVGSLDASAGRDARVQGSTVVADGNIAIQAARNLAITAAQNQTNDQSASSSHKSGSIGSGLQPAFGSVTQAQQSQNADTTLTGSQLASLGGAINLRAGEAFTQVASSVIAQGDISVRAKTVDILAGQETYSGEQHSQSSRTALGGSVSSPLLSAVQGLAQTARVAGETQDSRMQALAGMTAAFQAKDALNAAQALASGDPTKMAEGFKVSVSIGHSKSESSSAESASSALGSKLQAGGDLRLEAVGAGQASNLTVIGSQVQAGGTVALKADNAVSLQAASNTSELHSKNSSSGQSVGIGFAVGGQQNGFTIEASASQGKGRAEGSEMHWTNTQVAAKAIDVQSGGDTTLKGATLKADQVTAKIGGDLQIESLQDKTTYDAKQQSVGVGVSLCLPPICAGASSVSVSVNQAKVNGDFQSVAAQSGIQAGDGGFQLDVKGGTTLAGAAIASSQVAVDAGKNSLSTATLKTSDLTNHDEHKATSVAVSASVTSDSHNKDGTPMLDKQGRPIQGGSSVAPGIGQEKGSQGSVTASAISGGAITITDDAKQQALTGKDGATTVAAIKRDVMSNKDNSGALTQGWDGAKLMTEVQAQSQITQAAMPRLANEIGNHMGAKAFELQAQAEQARRDGDIDKANQLAAEAKRYDEGGAYRVAAHAALGALGGGAAGAAGAGLSAQTAPEIDKALKSLALPDPVREMLVTVGGTAVGAIAGGNVGAVTGGNQVLNNYLKHEQAQALLNDLAKCKASRCSESEYKAIVDRYAALSATNSAALDACQTRACLDNMLAQVESDAGTIRSLAQFERTKLTSTDLIGIATGDPSKLLQSPMNPADKLATGLYVSEKDVAINKIIANGWLKPEEKQQLAQWNTATAWADTMAASYYGHVPTVTEKAQFLALVYAEAGSSALPLSQLATQVTKGAVSSMSNAAKDAKTAKVAEQTAIACPAGACFVAGTLVRTTAGLQAIETFQGGELVFSRHERTGEVGYRPVTATKSTPGQSLYEIVVQDMQGRTETFHATAEHPFWVDGHGWRKAAMLEAGMPLLSGDAKTPLRVLSQQAIDHVDMVYNIQVAEHHTYHIGEFGVWVHNANCCDLANQSISDESKRGVVSNTKLSNNQIELDVTAAQQAKVADIAKNGDPKGIKTEALMNEVIESHGGKLLGGGKYGSNNGFDHVAVWTDLDGKVYMTLSVDSKQLGAKGVVLDPKAAGSQMQMSEKWDDVVLSNLQKDSPVRLAIEKARLDGTLVKGVAYVDKSTGTLNLTRIDPKSAGTPTAPPSPLKKP